MAGKNNITKDKTMNETTLTQTDNLTDPKQDLPLIDKASTMTIATPYFKTKYFVGGSQITPYGAIKQWLMELRTKEEACAHLEYLHKKQELEIELEQEKVTHATSPAYKKLAELELFNKQKDLNKYERNLTSGYTERNTVLRIIKEFLASEMSILSNGESIMTIFDDPTLEEYYEQEYWTARMSKQAAMDMVTYGRISTGNMDSIVMLPPEQQHKVLLAATEYSTKLDYGMRMLKEKTDAQLAAPGNKSKGLLANHLLLPEEGE